MTSIDVDLTLSLDRVASKLDGVRAQLAKPEAIFGRIVGYDVSGNNGVGQSGTPNIVFRLGGPIQGHLWLVRQLVVGGTLVSTAPAGSTQVFVGGASPGLALSTVDFRDASSLAFPQRAFYGRGEMIVEAGEKLWMVIVGPTQGTQYVVAGSVEDVEQGQGLVDSTP